MQAKFWLSGSAALLLVAVGVTWSAQPTEQGNVGRVPLHPLLAAGERSPRESPTVMPAQPALPSAVSSAAASTVASTTVAVNELEVPWDEQDVMAQLRQLEDSDPERSLRLAREGNLRFPDSPDAAERSWRVVKSLVNLQQFHAARDEAQAMVDHYPRSRFSLEVQRHLLVNPLDYPSREEQQRRGRH